MGTIFLSDSTKAKTPSRTQVLIYRTGRQNAYYHLNDQALCSTTQIRDPLHLHFLALSQRRTLRITKGYRRTRAEDPRLQINYIRKIRRLVWYLEHIPLPLNQNLESIQLTALWNRPPSLQLHYLPLPPQHPRSPRKVPHHLQ